MEPWLADHSYWCIKVLSRFFSRCPLIILSPEVEISGNVFLFPLFPVSKGLFPFISPLLLGSDKFYPRTPFQSRWLFAYPRFHCQSHTWSKVSRRTCCCFSLAASSAWNENNLHSRWDSIFIWIKEMPSTFLLLIFSLGQWLRFSLSL